MHVINLISNDILVCSGSPAMSHASQVENVGELCNFDQLNGS